VSSRNFLENKPFPAIEALLTFTCLSDFLHPVHFEKIMTKPHHKLKKANHGARPANAKARKAKRKKVRT
jgi:hypothetical protein